MNPQYLPHQQQYGGPDQTYGGSSSYPQPNSQLSMTSLDNSLQNQGISPVVGPPSNTQFQRFPPPGATLAMSNQMPMGGSIQSKQYQLSRGPAANGPVTNMRVPHPATSGGTSISGDTPSTIGSFSIQTAPSHSAAQQSSLATEQLSSHMSTMSLQNSSHSMVSNAGYPVDSVTPIKSPGIASSQPQVATSLHVTAGNNMSPMVGSLQCPPQGSVRISSQASSLALSQGSSQALSQGSMHRPSQISKQNTPHPMQGLPQGFSQGLSQVTPPASMLNPSQGSMHPPSQGPMQGLSLGSVQGPLQGSSQSSMQGPPQGSVRIPSQGMVQGPLQSLVQGSHQGPMQGPYQGPMQGPLQGQMQNAPQGSVQGLPQDSSQSSVQGPMKSSFQGSYSETPSQVPMLNSQPAVNGGFPVSHQMPEMPYPTQPPGLQSGQHMGGHGGPQYVNGMPGGGGGIGQPLSSYLQNRQMQQGSIASPIAMPVNSSGPYPSQLGPPMPSMHTGGQMLPMPGAHPSMGMATRPMHPSQAPQQQARRLDPDHMPSPIQVMQDDQRNHSGNFYTNQKGQVPPLVTTRFITQDQGNASPRFIRATMYSVPATMDIMKQTAVPFGLVISPLARIADGESLPPVVGMGDLGPVRCVRCKAYMCPYMQFMDGGRRFHCNFCKATTEVPPEYFQHLDHTGMRVDRYERPELVLGTYEFVATKDYCRNNIFPQPPAFIFLIDVSYNNIKSGMVHLLCQEMKGILQLLPKEYGAEKSSMKVGFITYNNTVHFYNIKGVLAQPQMMVVGDVQDMFMPLLDGFLCDPEESAHVIDNLMEQIPAMFAETRETETVLAPAIQAGLEALKAAECNGKLLVFHSSLPIADAPGKLKNRDDRKVLGTEKEKTVLGPQSNFYNNLGQECVLAGCSVDLFIFNNSYIDLATIGQVCRLTGGEIFKYTYFQADLDGERLIADIKRNVERSVAFDTVMRVRTSTGVRATDFYGHIFMANTTDMEIACIDCDKGVAVEIKHDDKLTEEDGVYVQVALLYTSCGGQRRLRIMNLSFKICTQMADLYRSCDLDTMINFFSKQSVFKLLDSTPKAVKDGLVARCAQILACYRKNCATPSSSGQLILPECMKLLPLYANCLIKSDAISGGADITIDDRSFVMQAVMIMDVPSSVVYFYPRLIPLHDLSSDPEGTDLPQPMRCLSEKMRDDGVYILENGIHMFLWIGLNVGVQWVRDVFGAQSAAQIDIDRTSLPKLDNPLSVCVRSIVEEVRSQRHRRMRLTLVRQRDKLEIVFKHFLVEDRGNDGSGSYVDFLCHMHKEIRELLR